MTHTHTQSNNSIPEVPEIRKASEIASWAPQAAQITTPCRVGEHPPPEVPSLAIYAQPYLMEFLDRHFWNFRNSCVCVGADG